MNEFMERIQEIAEHVERKINSNKLNLYNQLEQFIQQSIQQADSYQQLIDQSKDVYVGQLFLVKQISEQIDNFEKSFAEIDKQEQLINLIDKCVQLIEQIRSGKKSLFQNFTQQEISLIKSDLKLSVEELSEKFMVHDVNQWQGIEQASEVANDQEQIDKDIQNESEREEEKQGENIVNVQNQLQQDAQALSNQLQNEQVQKAIVKGIVSVGEESD